MKNPIHIFKSCGKRANQTSLSAFTLVELIVAVSVIIVLVAILLGAIGKARERADLTGSTSNLRSIGSAISLYVNDNQGDLPGPLARGQWAVYGLGSQSLLYHIGEYMGFGPRPETPEETRFMAAFACPGWIRNVSSEALRADRPTVVWWLSMEAVTTDSPSRPPWGEITSTNATRRTPVKHMNIVEPARQMAMQTVDAEIGPWERIPEKPVFGDVRNRLFFDWSVGTVPVEAGTEVFWPVRSSL